MSRIAQCLTQVNKIRSVAAGYEAAYVARSRLGRLVLELSLLTHQLLQLPAPEKPRQIVVPDDSPKQIRSLARACNRLAQTSKTITQPSEPLDERWRAGWSSLISDLDEIEATLQALRQQRDEAQSRMSGIA